jgi:predicted enzyme related to lactoylglutathione lyase
MSHFNSISVVSYYVRDWERAKAFYAEVLGWPVAYSNDEIGWIEYGDEQATHLALNRWDSDEPMPVNGGGTAVLAVESVKTVYAALLIKGVQCDKPVNIPGVVNYGTFYDPEGNRIQYAGDE